MLRDRKSFYVDAKGPDLDAVRSGLLWLSDAIRRRGCEGLLVVPDLRGLDHDVLKDVIGAEATAGLKKRRRLTLNGDVVVTLATWAKLPTVWNGPMLVLHPDKAALDKIDAILQVPEVLVVPWIPEEIHGWIATWGATDLLSGKSQRQNPLSPVVEEALRTLTRRVNVSTGILHPNDRAAAIDLFKRLRGARFKLEPEKIRQWLVRHNWAPRDAGAVKTLVEAIIDRRPIRGGRRAWADDIIDQLKSRVAKRAPS